MPRFSVAFSRRKSTADDGPAPESSFRVIERHELDNGKSFDGGARLARASVALPPGSKILHEDLEADSNMFAGLNINRGSGASNTTKATSTDTSSRHSNASTAPSSADLGANGHEEARNGGRKPLQEVPNRPAPVKTSGSSFLNRAGRTFSFGGAKKNSAPVPQDEPSPDIPPVPTIEYEDPNGRARGMTASTTSTATPPKLDEGRGMDLGGDFGSMFTTLDKRASTATMRNDGSPTRMPPQGNRQPQQLSPSPDSDGSVDPTPRSWESGQTTDTLLGDRAGYTLQDGPPPVPPHQPSGYKASHVIPETAEDEDTKLLQETVAAGRLLSGAREASGVSQNGFQHRQQDSFSSVLRKPIGTSSFGKQEENMFEGSLPRLSRPVHRYTSRPATPPKNKVMTPAQFEKYRQDKERLGAIDQVGKQEENEEEEDINYDEDEDEVEKSRQQAKQRRKQEAHMAVYRQQMMKVTGEPAAPPPMMSRPSLTPSLSAPLLGQQKTPSPDPLPSGSDEEEDEEVPLAILQAHGFPSKNRPPARMSTMGSNPNMRASTLIQSPRPGSAAGVETPPTNAQRHSTLPAFARGLPQDPFVGASLARPAMRESLALGGGIPANPTQGSLPPGGLVGVIASEERSRALRRGSPSVDNQKLGGGAMNMHGPGFDPMGGIPHQMMYGGGMGQMGSMGPMPPPQQMLTPGDQAQIQMTQQMQQFMQMQMQFMQMMANGPNNGSPPMPQQPYGASLAGSQSVVDLSARQSMMGDPMAEPRHLHPGMRTMSMVQPSSASFMQQPGYAPSIAPSERSNVGLPGRYRPVSQAAGTMLSQQPRSNTMSGALAQWDDEKRKSSVNISSKPGGDSDEDDDEGWEAMRAKRDKKRSIWKSKKGFGSELSAIF